MATFRSWLGKLGRPALALALGAGTFAVVAAPPASAATVEVSDRYAADPGFNRFGSTDYVYATGGADSGVLPIFATAADGTYAQVGNAFTAETQPQRLSLFWAPHVVKRGSTYFMFFAAKPELPADATAEAKARNTHCLYYAVSSTPDGGFHRTRKLWCDARSRWEAIDPSTYTTVEDNTYLVWRGGHVKKFPLGDYDIQARRLTFSGSTVRFTNGSTYTLAGVRDKPVMEAPDVIRHDHRLFLFVSRGRYDTDDYRTDVWSGASIQSPFTFSNRLMETGPTFGFGPGGAEVLGKPGKEVHIAYHVWQRSKPTPESDGGNRVTRVADVTWVDGRPTVG